MRIVDFGFEHIGAARQIARQNYETERSFVNMLPPVKEFPDLSRFAENKLGVAAFEGSVMVGYLCGVSPFNHAFGSTDAVGIFSPMHANGTITDNRAQIYARMYQAAGDKWAKAGASSHAVCLYAHDKAGQEQFFRYGFGLRCIDAIREMDKIESQPCHDTGMRCDDGVSRTDKIESQPCNRSGIYSIDAIREMDEIEMQPCYNTGMRCDDSAQGKNVVETVTKPYCCFEFSELTPEEYINVLPIDHMLDAHMAASPTFILRQSENRASFADNAARNHSRHFAVKARGRIIAFIKIERGGETFICETPDYIHINGAYCLPEYRGTGVFQHLLNIVIGTLKGEGYTRLGVDFESINPAAYGFWLKYFTAYTHSVTRRIDEHAIGDNKEATKRQ